MSRPLRISGRDKDVLEAILNGKDIHQMADEFEIEYRSVTARIFRLMEILGIHSYDHLQKPENRKNISMKARLATIRDRALKVENWFVYRENRNLNILTQNETNVVRCVAVGMSTKQIATVLGTTDGMVNYYCGRAQQKYGVRSREAMIIPALKRGDIKLDEFPDPTLEEPTTNKFGQMRMDAFRKRLVPVEEAKFVPKLDLEPVR